MPVVMIVWSLIRDSELICQAPEGALKETSDDLCLRDQSELPDTWRLKSLFWGDVSKIRKSTIGTLQDR